MQFIFFEPASDSSSAVRDRVLFIREDAESANWQEEEYSLQAMFPFLSEKEIKRGMRIGFTDEVGDFQAFEIRKVRNYEPDGYQEITAEHIVIAELTDEFTDEQSFTNVPPNVALAAVLSGTQWQVGTVAVGDLQAQQTARQNIAALQLNGNVDLTSRPVVSRAKMRASGYADFSAESATLYPQIYTWDVEENNAEVTKATFLITPIRQDGVVYSLDRLNDYVLDLYDASQTYADLTAADHDRLLIHVLSGKQLSAIENISDQAEALSAAWESAIVAEASSGDISRGKVWPAVCSIKGNWNVYITPRITWGSTGITGRYLDIETYGGVFRGLYLSIDKNADELGVTVDDTNVATAMFGFGRNIEDENTSVSSPLTFASVAWTQTADHPAKPSGQNYLENPAAAQYKRYGRHRWGFYQNSNIDDPVILLQKTWEALKQVSGPDVTINCVVRDMYRLGYKDVPMRLHDRAMVYEINTGETLLLEIVNLFHDLLNALETRPTIGKYIPNIIYINRETNEGKRSFGGGGSKGQSAEEYERGEFETAIDYNKYQIGLRATQYDLKDQSYRTALAQAQIDIQHNAIDSIVGGVGMTLDANGYAVLDANGNPVFNVGSKTVFSRVNQLAEQYAVQVVNDKMSGYLLINNLSTEMGNVMTGSNGETIAANIVTKINDNQGTIYLNSDHVKLKDGSVITASTLDSRLANIDALFTTNGYAAQIKAGTINSGGNINADGAVYGTGIYIKSGTGGGTNVQYADVSNAVKTIRKDTSLSDGLIGFEFQTLTGTSWTKVNFNIADTSYYQAHVGIDAANLTLTEIGATPYNASDAAVVTGIEAGTADKYFLIAATPKAGDTVYKKFVLPAAAAPAVTTDPKISKKSWSSGQIQLDASSDPNDPASVTIALTGGTTGSLIYGNSSEPTTPTGIKFDILEDLGGSTADTGADVVASVARGAATVKLGTSNNAPAIVANTAGYVTVGGQRIQVGVTPLAVTPGIATPNTPTWNSSTHKYAITADGSVSIGSDSLALTRGSLSGDFSPTQAFTYGFNECFNSVELTAAKTTINPGETVDVIPKMKGTWDASAAQAFSGKKLTITAAQAATVTPKVSKKSWASGSLTFEGTTASSDPTSAGVTLGWITVPNTSSGNASLSVVDKDSPYSSAQPHTVMTKALTLTCEDDAAYLKDGGTTIAKVPNNKTADPVTVNVSKGSWSSGAIQFSTDPASGTGKNVSLGMTIPANTSNGNAQITIVDKASPGSSSQPLSTGLTKTLTLTCEDDAAYLRDGSKIIAKVPNNKTTPTVSASIDNITGSAIDDTNTRETVPISASGTNVTSRTEYAVLKRDTYGSAGNKCVTLTMDGVVIGRISAQTFYTEGRNSVKITNVERVASCAIDEDAQTAKQDVRFTLSNGETYTIHENFSDVYRDGRAGRDADTTIEYAVDLASDGVYFDTVDEGLTIDVSDIYQAGQNYTPPVKHWYTYSPTGGDVPIYVQSVGSSSGSSGSIGEAIGNLLTKFTVSTTIAFYPYTPVEVVGTLRGYTQVTYNGTTYLLDPSNLKQSETDLSIGHRIGIKDLTAYAVSTTMTGLIHTGGATSGISVYLEPYNGTAKNYTSSYVPSSDFSSYRANGSASSYFYEMAAKSGYYGRHEKTDYSGDIQHKAIFEILYSDGNTETVVVSFNSYAKAADEVVYTYPGYIDANNYVNLRSTNSTAGTVLAQVPDRSTVMCQYNPNGYTGTWMPVQYGGKTGYIQSKFIEGTKDWNDLNTKTISTITLVGVAHAMGSSKKDIVVTLHPQKNGMKFVTSYATESSEYTYNWAVTNTDTDTYLLHPISGCYMYHSKSACSSSVRMRVKLRVTYTNSSKFPAEEVVLQVTSVAK